MIVRANVFLHSITCPLFPRYFGTRERQRKRNIDKVEFRRKFYAIFFSVSKDKRAKRSSKSATKAKYRVVGFLLPFLSLSVSPPRWFRGWGGLVSECADKMSSPLPLIVTPTLLTVLENGAPATNATDANDLKSNTIPRSGST